MRGIYPDAGDLDIAVTDRGLAKAVIENSLEDFISETK